jgi:hypothetical protein
MAQVIYNNAKRSDINLATADIRCLLLGGASVPAGCLNPDLDTVAAVLAVSGANELNATNYARKTTTRTDTVDDANDRSNVALSASVVWTALGGALNDTVRAVLFYTEGGGSDATRVPVSIHEYVTPIPTNGGDHTIPTGDIIRTA